MPVSRFKSSEEVQAVVAFTQLKVLSVAPFTVIPPPSAVIFVGDATEANSRFLSSTVRVVEFTVVVVPLTVKLPLITTSALLIVAVPVAAPIEIVVAAPAKFTVVAVSLTSANVVLGVVNDVVIAGLVPKTSAPEPVSSLITPRSSEELVAANALSLLSVSILVRKIKSVGGTGAALMACAIQRAIVNTA